jgi:hypothetical protein
MKFIFHLFLFQIAIFQTKAQNVVFGFPEDLAFIERDTNSMGQVHIYGTLEPNRYTAIRLTIKSNNKVYFKNRIELNGKKEFNWELGLLAGLFEYDFELKGFLQNDSTTIASATKVLCGDSFLIYGQSNAVAGCCYDDIRLNYDHKYLRSYAFDYLAPTSTNNGWNTIHTQYDWPGAMGSWLAQLIVREQKIPVCVLNGATGGVSIDHLSDRDPIDHFNSNTIYGRFITRIKNSGIKNPKGFIFSQGEWEVAAADASRARLYGFKYEHLMQLLNEDIPPSKNYYLIQTNISNDRVSGPSGAILRNEQRKLKDKFPELNLFAGFGRELSSDGWHYTQEGYFNLAEDLYKSIRYEVYGIGIPSSITGPLVKKVINSREGNYIRVVFEENQNMKSTNVLDYGNYQRRIKDYFYNESGSTFIDSSRSSGNVVKLYYSRDFVGNKLTYLPSFFSNPNSVNFNGPLLMNVNGLPALSFFDVDVCEAFKTPIIDTFMLYNIGIKIILARKEQCIDCNLEIDGSTINGIKYSFNQSTPYTSDTIFVDLSWAKREKHVNLKIKTSSANCESEVRELSFNRCPDPFIRQQLPFAVKKMVGDSLIYESSANGRELMLKFERFIELRPGFQTTGSPSLAEIKQCLYD